MLTRQLVIKDLVDGHKWARNVTSNFTSTLTSGLRLIKLVKKRTCEFMKVRNMKMKLKGYSIWVCGNCHAKFFIDKKPSYCPCCRSTKQLGCAGYVKLDFDF